MAAQQRKLQKEMETTLKRIAEGCGEWDALLAKFEEQTVRFWEEPTPAGTRGQPPQV
jgi:DNA topoisomerase IA